jgi:hypothetical protein
MARKTKSAKSGWGGLGGWHPKPAKAWTSQEFMAKRSATKTFGTLCGRRGTSVSGLCRCGGLQAYDFTESLDEEIELRRETVALRQRLNVRLANRRGQLVMPVLQMVDAFDEFARDIAALIATELGALCVFQGLHERYRQCRRSNSAGRHPDRTIRPGGRVDDGTPRSNGHPAC